MDQKQSKALEKIEKAGLTEKHNQLVAQGYTNGWINYKLLKDYDGNIEQVVQIINDFRKKREEKEQRIVKVVETLGWQERNQELINKGFTDTRKNLKVLLKVEGDVVKAEEKLLKRKNFKNELKDDQPIEQQIESHGFKVQNDKLKEMGYDNERRNFKLLLKFNGNLEAVLDRIFSRGPKFGRFGPPGHGHGGPGPFGHKHGHRHGCGSGDEKKNKVDKESKEFLEFKDKKKEFKKKIHQLHSEGVHHHKAVKLLAIWNGDVDAVIKWSKIVKPQQQQQTLNQVEQKQEETLTQQ